MKKQKKQTKNINKCWVYQNKSTVLLQMSILMLKLRQQKVSWGELSLKGCFLVTESNLKKKVPVQLF